MTTTDNLCETVEARTLSVTLGRQPILNDISTHITQGTRVALVGPNGSGKTTLLRTFAGLLKPTSGDVLYDGCSLSQLNPKTIATRLSYMPQQLEIPLPLSCLEIVLLGRSPHKRGLGLADSTDLRLARSAMERIGVEHLASRSIARVSGGERQRLMLAQVLVQECPFMLLDEPTSAQDPYGVLLVAKVIQEANQDGVGILAAVHDLNLALAGFDRIIVLKEGTILLEAPPNDVLESGALEETFAVDFHRINSEECSYVVSQLRRE